ncbi:energy-coupling factor ABC transporter permease [Agaribacter flavus]|uniref:Energy-coupling factor ABC transporter permease n=1 Tax=Agaribacter flavus TaxID=1902781 RepID=A0ABV7FMU2_9ALTE
MTAIQLTCLIIYLLCSAYVIKHTSLQRLLHDKKLQHRLFGASTVLFILWLFRVSIHDGLVMHFLGLTALCLILGFRWSLISATSILLVITVLGYESYETIGVNGLFGVILPLTVSYGIYMLTFHKMQRHLFIYIFICGFLAGALSIALKMGCLSGYYYIDGFYEWNVITYNYTQMIVLLVFQEAFFNGMLMTCLIVYKPEWVYTFSDKFYLDGK